VTCLKANCVFKNQKLNELEDFLNTNNEMFYIQCTSQLAGDFILWWCPKRLGYTYNLKDAGLYPKDEAESICKLRGEERAWPKEEVEKRISTAVNIGHLHMDGIKPVFDEKSYKKPKVKKHRAKPRNCNKCGRFFSDPDPYQETCEDCYDYSLR